MNDPVFWGRTQLTWSAEGYRLTLTIFLDVRGSALFASRLPDVLRGFEEFAEADTSFEFTGGYRWENDRGVGHEPAELTIIAPRTLFAIEAGRLRSALSELAIECRREGDEQQERDEELAESWLKDLRSAGARSS